VTYPFKPGTDELTVTVIDTGQGESQVVEFPGGRLMVIDAGGFYRVISTLERASFLLSSGQAVIKRLIIWSPATFIPTTPADCQPWPEISK